MSMREFDAHEWKRVPKQVRFKTKDGENIRFCATEEKRLPKHVRFTTRNGGRKSGR